MFGRVWGAPGNGAHLQGSETALFPYRQARYFQKERVLYDQMGILKLAQYTDPCQGDPGEGTP